MPPSGPIERAFARAEANRAEGRNARQSDNSPSTPLPISSELTGPSETTTIDLCSRRRVHVNKLSERYAATSWMVAEAAENGDKHIVSKAVKKFPSFFAGNNKANLQKASRWWSMREETMALKKTGRAGSLTAHALHGVKRAHFKALKGRGRKRSQWVSALYPVLLAEFERLKAAGLKFSPAVIRRHAIELVSTADENKPYHATVQDKGQSIVTRITIRWVQHFMTANNIVLRAQTGKLLASPEKEMFIEKSVAFHLGVLKRGF